VEVSPTSSRSERLGRALAIVSAVISAGCSRSFDTVTSFPREPRRPDGVALEQPLTVPESVERGRASSSIVTLRERYETAALVGLVRAYFRAFEREDADGLGRLLAQDAVLLRRPGANVVESFRARMRTYEYQRIAGLEVARFDKIERYGSDDVVPFSKPAEMQEGDVLVRVPVLVSRVGGDPLFGEVLVLLVRREEGELRIAGVAEDPG
jgi:hypothetical protein